MTATEGLDPNTTSIAVLIAKMVNNSQNNSVLLEPAETSAVSPPILKKIHDILLVMLLVYVMFSMGCSITWEQVWGHVKKPYGVLIGMLSQFVLLPFCAYHLINLMNLDPLHSTGLLILACSPGGITSNIFTHFCEGDLSLSVTMTAFSTVVALFMMPFNLWLYGSSLRADSVYIPYSKMSISLIAISAPVVVGMVFYYKYPKLAPILTKIGSVSGFGIILICQTLEVLIFPDMFTEVPLTLYFAELILPVLGLIIGYFAASVFGLPQPVRRTVAIESSIQNVGTSLTIITLSFPYEQLRKVWLFPYLYAFTSIGICLIFAAVYRGVKLIRNTHTLDINSKAI